MSSDFAKDFEPNLDPTRPTAESAYQFALILSSGVPPLDGLGYMLPDSDQADLRGTLGRWMKDDRVQRAILTLQGKRWEEMSLEEKIRYSIDKHYTELAYYLYSHNYAELMGADRAKSDACREALERKLAGMAGKVGPLEAFWADVVSGKVKVADRAMTRPGN